MAVKFSGSSSLFLVITTSLFVIAMSKHKTSAAQPSSHRNGYNFMPPAASGVGWGWGFGGGAGCSCGEDGGFRDLCRKTGQNEFIVGGTKNWQFGFNYSVWAGNMCGLFHVNDILVFKYNHTEQFKHSVYLLKDLDSYRNCSLVGSKKICEVDQGTGEGCKYKLEQRSEPYYLACGEKNGLHCNLGLMKFAVWPLANWNFH